MIFCFLYGCCAWNNENYKSNEDNVAFIDNNAAPAILRGRCRIVMSWTTALWREVLSSRVKALDLADGQFAFELYGQASSIGRNPGVHIFAGSCSAVTGEYEGDVMALVLLFIVLDGFDTGVLDGQQLLTFAAEDVDGEYMSFPPCIIRQLAHIGV